MVTISDVAQEANVSIATVSRVINNSECVAVEKRERVLLAIDKLGYQAVRTKTLKTPDPGADKVIAVINGLYLNRLPEGIEKAARELGYYIVHLCTYDSPNENFHCKKIIQKLSDIGMSGILLVNCFNKNEMIPDEFNAYPLVQIGGNNGQNPAYVVFTDDEKASCELTNMLIRKGHRRIAYLGDGENRQDERTYSEARENGFFRAMRQNKLPVPDEMIFISPLCDKEDTSAARYFISLDPRPDAIVCATDKSAFSLVRELTNLGVCVPEDIAVTGFDNSSISETSIPQLTTVAQNFFEIGRESVYMLDRMLSGCIEKGQTIYVDYEIIERGSTK